VQAARRDSTGGHVGGTSGKRSDRVFLGLVLRTEPHGSKMRDAEKGTRGCDAIPRDCGTCPLKSRCTLAPRRGLARHLYEDALNRMLERITPEAMRLHRCTVAHPFATIKYRIFGRPRLLMRAMSSARIEVEVYLSPDWSELGECLFARGCFKKPDDVCTFISLWHMETHIVIGNQRFRIGKPLIQRNIIPCHVRGFQSVRIIEGRNAACRPAIDIP
jgi:hypothetical protein